MSRIRVAVEIGEEALIEQCLAYVSDPRPGRRRHHRELFDLLKALGQYRLDFPAELLELLVVDGGATRTDVAGVVSSWYEHAAPVGIEPRPGEEIGAASNESPPARITMAAMPAVAGRLTRREADVLRLVTAGQTNRQIADGLGLSPHTVKRHVDRILVKLDLPSRAAAAAFAVQSGVV